MAEVKEKGMFLNPYVIQMDKFAEALKHISGTFLKLEDYRAAVTKDETWDMFQKVTDKVCRECERRETCLEEKQLKTYQMMYDILCAVEEYGAELNVELKRNLQKKCIMAPRFLRETLEAYEYAKQSLLWNNRIVQNREGYARQLTNFAKTIQFTTRELDAGIFEDEHLEKKIKNHLKKSKIRVLSSVFYITPQGKYEIHLTLKAAKGHIVPVKELAAEIGKLVGRTMIPEQGERPIIGDEYCTITCMEGARFHTLQGLAKIGKDCDKISGDTFLMADLPGGKKGVALSDGMGSGEEAFRESTMVVELLEELLNAGFPVKTAVQIMNTALVIGREEVRFSTIDVSLFDLYSGTCEFVKAGASTTYLKREKEVEAIHSVTLPIGVIQDIEIETEVRELSSGDFVVMVTDGVVDALPPGRQDEMMSRFIMEADMQNPKEMAHYILGQVLECSQEVPVDDMTVLVVGIWKI
ncbi:SpoIIE family protein phosphatase [Faecalicatena contorta]|uniref:SpoIIE family protein phosphatase n=1 Tax=Faecalicatena contorta TaxID=39482 RepID=UPI001F1DDFBA|nr:SpoIIE family protein phosphatase [Faecalicatena contorta]MCF2554739.1 SpoIIE family protein phosphatase [Faecalicatena contorta]MCF2679171.1 SpoIIE family protein phosphatase [Faecalicatena contorta]